MPDTSISLNPQLIIEILDDAPAWCRYPVGNEADRYRGWAGSAAFPLLHDLMIQTGDLPTPLEGCNALMTVCDPRYTNDVTVKRRAVKLYLDFVRDMHAMAMLKQSSYFGVISYVPSLDINYNVDFISSLMRSMFGLSRQTPAQAGIQAAMRGKWAEDTWTEVKEARKKRRNVVLWDGPIFWLTNRHRAHYIHRKTGNWLYTHDHVRDLIREMKIELCGNAPDAGIQTRLPDDRP
jgi:hypothetical protein